MSNNSCACREAGMTAEVTGGSFFRLMAGPVIVALVLLAVLLLQGCGHQAGPPPAAPPRVSVLTLKTEAVAMTTELPGRIVAYRVAEVRPQVNGIVQKRLYTEGAEVRAGQALYQIDAAPYQAAYDSAFASATSARLQAERYKPLAEANAISRQEYDNAVAADLQARAALETARINLAYTRVLAPISGRIGRSSITEGALVTANQTTALATIQQLDTVYVDVTQPSGVLLRLQRELAAGQLQRASDGGAQVRLKLEDGSAYDAVGKLQFSEVAVDEGTGSVTLRALFPNPGRVLLPGMFVHEHIEEGQRPDAVLVPQQGVTHDQKGDPVALLVKPDNTVELRKLMTERAIGDRWLVSSGLQAGDRVIVEGLQSVRPGMAVEASEYQASQATAAGTQPVAQPVTKK